MPATKIYVDKEEPRFVTVDFPSRESGREFYRLATKHGGFEFGAGSGGGSSDISFEFPSVSAAKAFVRDVSLSSSSAKMVHNQNPSREANVVIGGGLGVLLGGILLGLPGALVGGGIGAVLGSESGDTRRRALENPQRTPSVMGCDTEAQTLIFDRRVFNTVGEAQKWARANGFKSTKVDTNINTYRLRQKLPSAFLRGSFRTVTFRSGVQAVIGCPRMVRRKNG